MKHFTIILFSLFLSFSALSQSVIVKTNPFAIFVGSNLLSLEFALGNHLSTQISGTAGGYSLFGIKRQKYGGAAQVRYYPDESFKKLYFAIGGRYDVREKSYRGPLGIDDEDLSYNVMSIGPRAGYQFVFDSKVTFDINFGVRYNFIRNVVNVHSDDIFFFSYINVTNSGINPIIAASIGYSF